MIQNNRTRDSLARHNEAGRPTRCCDGTAACLPAGLYLSCTCEAQLKVFATKIGCIIISGNPRSRTAMRVQMPQAARARILSRYVPTLGCRCSGALPACRTRSPTFPREFLADGFYRPPLLRTRHTPVDQRIRRSRLCPGRCRPHCVRAQRAREARTGAEIAADGTGWSGYATVSSTAADVAPRQVCRPLCLRI